MKFAFLPQSCLPFHDATLNERPLGGTETAVIRLARALDSFGHDVTVFTTVENPPLSSPLYLPFRAIADLGPVDVLVAVRDWQPVLLPLGARCRCFWTGDSSDQLSNAGLGDRRVAAAIDFFLAVSEWHRHRMCEHSGFPREKSALLRNGVELELFQGEEQRVRKRLIYSSTPYRGLQYLPGIYRRIKERHPDAELLVFSSFDVYAGLKLPGGALQEYEKIKTELQKLPDCHVHGSVTQARLAREFMKSSLLAYPNTFEETSCITALEAQAAGCAIVTSDRGALRETVGAAGILISGEASDEQYQDEFVASADKILGDETVFRTFSQAGKQQAAATDWKKIAADFVSFLQEKGIEKREVNSFSPRP
jgi:glycosyltransferase involved in cell wall biosynthesis